MNLSQLGTRAAKAYGAAVAAALTVFTTQGKFDQTTVEYAIGAAIFTFAVVFFIPNAAPKP